MNPADEPVLVGGGVHRAAAAPLGERLAATPRLTCETLQKAVNSADLDAALECFAPGAGLLGAVASAS